MIKNKIDLYRKSAYKSMISFLHVLKVNEFREQKLDGNKATGIDDVTKEMYGVNLESNLKDLVCRLKNRSYKPLPKKLTMPLSLAFDAC